MNRLEKIKMAIEKGFTCNPETGEIYGIKGQLYKRINNGGYNRIVFNYDKKRYSIKTSHFIWYVVYNEIVDFIDHIDRNRANDKISNLRSVTPRQNNFNKSGKGYFFNKLTNTYRVRIIADRKTINLGTYKTEIEARQAYLDAKKIYHKI